MMSVLTGRKKGWLLLWADILEVLHAFIDSLTAAKATSGGMAFHWRRVAYEVD